MVAMPKLLVRILFSQKIGRGTVVYRDLVGIRGVQRGRNCRGNSSDSALDSVADMHIILGMLVSVSRRARTIQAPVWLFALGQ